MNRTPFNYETVRLMMNMFDTGTSHPLLSSRCLQLSILLNILINPIVHYIEPTWIIDNSGMINFAEFSGLWQYIEEWRTCFAAFDQDKSGSIDFNELKTAMRSFRYNLSDDFLRLLIKKYDRTGTYFLCFLKEKKV